MRKFLSALAIMTLVCGLAFAQAQGQAKPPAQGQPQQGQPGQAQPSAKNPQQPPQPSPDEIATLQKANDQMSPPDQRLLAAEEFLAKYPDSPYKPYAYLAEMQAYQDKNDALNTVGAAEKVMEIDPQNQTGAVLPALVTAAEVIAMRTRENEIDKEQKYKKGEDYANRAIKMLEALQKPAGMPDEIFQAQRNGGLATAYGALGTIAVGRKQLAVAEGDYKKAMDLQAKQPMYSWQYGRTLAQQNKLPAACAAYQAAQLAGGVKNSLGQDLVDADRTRLDDVMKKAGTAEGCPKATPPPATPAPVPTPPAAKQP